jgi:hypothetical protein
MATYPVTGGDDASLLDAVNYAVSGPSGIGQQLQGFSSSEGTRLTGNFNVPFTNNGNFLPTAAVLYVEGIPLSTSEWLDDYTWKYNFTTTQFYPPFALGAGVSITGVTPSEYDSNVGTTANRFRRTGVVECSTDYVILRSSEPLPNPGVVGTGGFASLWVTSDPDPNTGGTGALINTDANAIVSVDAGNNLVSVTGQLYLAPFDYAVFQTDYPATVPEIAVYVKLNRYRATNIGTVAIPEYSYEFDTTIASQRIYQDSLTEYSYGVPTSYNIVSGTSGPSSMGFYPGVQADSTTGDGTNAMIWLYIVADSTDYTTSIDDLLVDGGGNYAVGDQLTFGGQQLGGTTPDNNLVLEVASITNPGDITVPESLTIFTPIVDTPPSGLYQYIIQVQVEIPDLYAQVAVKSMFVGRRSLTAQIIKK